MLVFTLIVAVLLAVPSAVADAPQESPSPAPQVRKVGEKLDYSLHAVLSQSIAGKDAFGKTIAQSSVPTNVKGFESILVTKIAAEGVTLHRLGTITATVDGAHPVSRPGQGWTLVDAHGKLVRDSGKLGGLFLLPLPFLGEAAVKAGDDLTIGDRWSGKLGTKLYGMTAQPELLFTVTGVRSVLGVHVFMIQAVGSVPMKEAVTTTSGEALGYAAGTARITAEFDYDRDNRRLISMTAAVQDAMHYVGPTKHTGGIVHDSQKCSVALDPASMTSGVRGVDAGGPPQ